MLPDSYRELFSVLAAKTGRGEVNWTFSPRSGTFVVSFADFGLSVYSGEDERGETFILFKLINDKGRDADSFFVSESDSDWEAAFQLYAGAKRKAQRIDLTIEKVLGELRKPGPVGEAPSEPVTDDDLPF